ncbi:hypothetical protein JT321_gp62 [Providencia phage Kokobel1]|uniref:Uncharacterized protein n=1 Tax=Providencia phage Kokobel1 TaxID=2783540 RepID=A0A873WLZ9_9CAUD|nr:hypothetical protein JT321_gp62 [Providencia phage Kokobel1]QPB11489.1 hypothetical protein [Providencia phage Kokobel1]
MADKKLKGLAARGGVRFLGAALCVPAFAACVGWLAVNDALTVGRFCLYLIAFGVCGGVMWPDQEEGEAFLNHIGVGDEKDN